jgi:TPR repeat protein
MKSLSGIVVLSAMIMAGCAKKAPTFSPELVSKAEAGDAVAQCNLGWCYANGTGVEKDEKEAVKWYTKSA